MTRNSVINLFFFCVMLSLAACLLTATLWAAPAPATPAVPQTVQWEFATLKVPVDHSVKDLGAKILKLGREGWELVSVANFTVDGTTRETAYYFKRQL